VRGAISDGRPYRDMYENGVKHSDTPDLIRHFWLADYPPATPVKRAFRSIGVRTLESLDCDLSPSVGSKSWEADDS
jgi:hypothetical protein